MFRLLGCALIVLCAGCSLGSPDGENRKNLRGMSEWTDPDSGCKYIIWRERDVVLGSDYGGITPKLKQDGTPDCQRWESLDG